MNPIVINGTVLCDNITGIPRYVYETVVRLDKLIEGTGLDVRIAYRDDGRPIHLHLPPEVPGDKVGDEAIEHFTKGGLPAAVVSNDCQEVPLRDSERNIVQGGLRGAWICIGQVVDLNRIHLSRPRSFPCSFS